MSQTVNLDRAEIAQAELAKEGLDPGPPLGTVDELKAGKGTMDVATYDPAVGQLDDDVNMPSEEELNTLRRVSGHISWAAYSVAFCELAERFSYYGAASTFLSPHPPPPSPDASRDRY